VGGPVPRGSEPHGRSAGSYALGRFGFGRVVHFAAPWFSILPRAGRPARHAHRARRRGVRRYLHLFPSRSSSVRRTSALACARCKPM